MTIDEIIDILADARTTLENLKAYLDLTDIEDVYDYILIQIDLLGCELTQNIVKKLKER